jgi:hypothetical protein
MAHAKKEHLAGFEFVLSEIRKNSDLREKSFGCFYRKSKGVLHFHIKGDRLYVHVFNGNGWQEVDLKGNPSVLAQKKVYKRIVSILSSTVVP